MSDLESVIQQDIYKIVDELKRCNNINIYNELTSALYGLNELIEYKNLDINFPKEIDYEYIKKNKDPRVTGLERLFFSSVDKNYNYNYKLAKMNNKLSNRYVMYREYNELKYYPFEKSLVFAADFFNEFDKDLYNVFLEIVNSPRFVLLENIECYDGWVLRNNRLIESYLVLVPNYNIIDFISLLHETMHLYNYKILRGSSLTEFNRVIVNSLYESPSFFIEHLGLDYLNTKNFNQDETKKLDIVFDLETIYLLQEYERLLCEGITDYDEYQFVESYCYGRVLSYHFYDNYLKNPKKTIEELKKFMYDYKMYDRDYLLDNYGLNSSSITNPQRLIKYMDRHLMRL